MLNEYFEEREFAGRERHVVAVACQAAGAEVQAKITEFDDLRIGARRARWCGWRAASQYRLYPGDELARIERFRQVIIGTDFQSDDAVDIVTFRGEHDDRHVLVAASQPTADRKTVLTGQHEVEK